MIKRSLRWRLTTSFNGKKSCVNQSDRQYKHQYGFIIKIINILLYLQITISNDAFKRIVWYTGDTTMHGWGGKVGWKRPQSRLIMVPSACSWSAPRSYRIGSCQVRASPASSRDTINGKDLLTLTSLFASLAFKAPEDKEWCKRRFAILRNRLRL